MTSIKSSHTHPPQKSMNVLIYGVTGMLGQAALRECLIASDVKQVGIVVRTPTGLQNDKLVEYVVEDLLDHSAIESELSRYDACIFCIGVTSGGMSEAQYTRITHDLTLSVAERLFQLNAKMGFVYVSGQGADSTEKGRVMWARVRGRTENDLFKLADEGVYALRPGFIQPLHGIQSKTPSYRWLYALLGPLLTPLRALTPGWVLTTEIIGIAMLNLLRQRSRSRALNASEIRAMTH